MAVTFAFAASFAFGVTPTQILFKGEVIDTSTQPPKAIPSAGILTDRKIYLVIQFRDLIHEKTKKEIKRLGGEFLSYIPNQAFVIRAPERSLPALSQLQIIQWIGDYTPNLKIDPELFKNDAANEEMPLSIQIKLFRVEGGNGLAGGSLKRFIEQNQGKILYNERDILKVSVPRKLIHEIAQWSAVEWIEESRRAELLSFINHIDGEKYVDALEGEGGDYKDLSGFESGVKILNPAAPYELGLRGSRQIVAVADTGLDVGSADSTLSLDFQKRIFKGYALGFWRDSWSDEMGHGTHVSGSILGTGDYSSGLLAGVAHEAQLIMQSTLGALGTVDIPPDLGDLFQPVYNDGARIHSNSWGHPAFGYEQTAQTLDRYVWDHPDFLVVAAGGNGGVDSDKDGVVDSMSLLSPATAKNCVTVGASENYVLKGGVQKPWGKFKEAGKNWGAEPIASDMPSDNPNGLAAFSSRGPTPDGRLKPDLVAPGTNVLSARSHMPDSDKLWGEYNEHYLWSGGTSMATPLVSGSAALVRQFYVEKQGLRFVSAALIKATLINGADDLYPGQFGFGAVEEIPSQRPNIHEGWGRVNLEKTLVYKNRALQFFDETVGVSTGKEKTYQLTVTDSSQPLKITLAYTDYPGSTSASKALVNDLDLIVRFLAPAPNRSKTHFPNGLNSADRLNNVEGVDILTPEVGTYTITVRGHHIPNGRNGAQPYALVMTGGI
jgi:subtilisin family serine protease